ncbi:hypothetical protein [Streptomyces sp. Go-475]|uniref:hypothetical protein n=1 Tax=Streptomyces sp. Go-475 TaxID=2072505 RepID=UPI000DF063E2|nr:hypothetical protein [Streptomyces sp. Go-475]AXE90501.1 hypothetical protein C1703_36260 [Streptomyces sp. Go-475]
MPLTLQGPRRGQGSREVADRARVHTGTRASCTTRCAEVPTSGASRTSRAAAATCSWTLPFVSGERGDEASNWSASRRTRTRRRIESRALAGGSSSFDAHGLIVLAACSAAGVGGILAAGGLSRPLLRAVTRQAGAHGEWVS